MGRQTGDQRCSAGSILTTRCLHVPVMGGKAALGTWQGIYLAEHRTRPHRREVILQFIGSRRPR